MEIFFSNSLDRLCTRVRCMHGQDSTKQFRIRRTPGGLWRLVVT